jgi:hypothetical protein
MIHFVFLIACAAVIYMSCEWFVNAAPVGGPASLGGPVEGTTTTITAAANDVGNIAKLARDQRSRRCSTLPSPLPSSPFSTDFGTWPARGSVAVRCHHLPGRRRPVWLDARAVPH